MFIYLLVFFIAIVSTYFAEVSLSQKYKGAFFLFSIIAVLLPSLLAGFRDSGIGTDTIVYVDGYWQAIVNIESWSEFIKIYEEGGFQNIEFIYLILNFITSRFTAEVNAIYFITNFIVVLLVYCSAYDNRNRASMWFIMYIFLFSYYNLSYNLVRQSLAIFMAMYSFKYIEQRRWIMAIIWGILIIKTHSTGVFHLLLVGFYFLFLLKNKLLRNSILIIILITIPPMLAFMDFVMLLLVQLQILPDRLLIYLSYGNDLFSVKTSFFASMMMFFIIFYISLKISKLELKFYSYVKLIGSMLFLSSLVSQWAYRISYYINFTVDCIFLARALHLLKNKSKKKYKILLIFCMTLCFCVWFYLIIIQNVNQTYPYSSKILGIE